MNAHVVGDVDIVSMCSEGGRNAWAETGESATAVRTFFLVLACCVRETITNYGGQS